MLAFSLSCAPRTTKKENCRQFADKAGKFLRILPDSAKLYLEKTIACSTDYVDAYIVLAKLYAEDEQYEKAESTYKHLISHNPRNPKGYSGLGLIYLKLMQFNDAIAEYEKGISVDPKDASIYHGLGFVYEEMGEFAETESLYEIAHKLDHKNYTIMYDLAGAYLKNEKCEQAITLFEKVEKNFPEDREITLSLADAYYDCKDYSKALKKYLLLISDLPDISSLYLKAGKCYEGLKQYDNAAAYLDTAIEKSLNKLFPYYHIINMYMRMGNLAAAKKYVNAAFKFAPNDPALLSMMGDIHIGYGDIACEREEFNNAVANYQNAKVWFKKAGFSGEGGIDRANQRIKNILKTAGMIKGKITDATNGEYVPFVNVVIVGAKKGTISDLNGEYYIILSQGMYDLQVRVMGYETSTARNVKAKAGETTIVNFELDLEKIKNPKSVIYAPSPP